MHAPKRLVDGAVAVPRGFLWAPHPSRVGDEGLRSREAGDGMDLVPEDQGEDRPHPREAAQEVEAVGVVLLGGPGAVPRQVGEPPVTEVKRVESHLDGLADVGSGESLRDPPFGWPGKRSSGRTRGD